MFIVPLPGDVILSSGSAYTVASFAPHKKNAAVYVESDDEKLPHILFSEIQKINAVPVIYNSHGVFSCMGQFDRKIHLPQVDDEVTVDTVDDTVKLKVKFLKFNKTSFSSGLEIVGIDDEKKKQTVRLRGLMRIERAQGGDLFSRKTFIQLYEDYLGVK